MKVGLNHGETLGDKVDIKYMLLDGSRHVFEGVKLRTTQVQDLLDQLTASHDPEGKLYFTIMNGHAQPALFWLDPAQKLDKLHIPRGEQFLRVIQTPRPATGLAATTTRSNDPITATDPVMTAAAADDSAPAIVREKVAPTGEETPVISNVLLESEMAMINPEEGEEDDAATVTKGWCSCSKAGPDLTYYTVGSTVEL